MVKRKVCNVCVNKFETPTHNDLQRDEMDSKSVELRFMSVRVGLGVPSKLNLSMGFRLDILFCQQSFF